MNTYAVRYKSAPREIRIERAETPERAFKLAFGLPPFTLRSQVEAEAEYIDLGPRRDSPVSKERQRILNDPTRWVTFKRREGLRSSVEEALRLADHIVISNPHADAVKTLAAEVRRLRKKVQQLQEEDE